METNLMGRTSDSTHLCFSQSLSDNWVKLSPGRKVIPQLPAADFFVIIYYWHNPDRMAKPWLWYSLRRPGFKKLDADKLTPAFAVRWVTQNRCACKHVWKLPKNKLSHKNLSNFLLAWNFQEKNLFPRHFIHFSFYLGSMQAARKKIKGKRKSKEKGKKVISNKTYTSNILSILNWVNNI